MFPQGRLRCQIYYLFSLLVDSGKTQTLPLVLVLALLFRYLDPPAKSKYRPFYFIMFYIRRVIKCHLPNTVAVFGQCQRITSEEALNLMTPFYSSEVFRSQPWSNYGPTEHDRIESSLTRVTSYRDHSSTKPSTMVSVDIVESFS